MMVRCLIFGHRPHVRVTGFGREAICVRCGVSVTVGRPDLWLEDLYL